MTDEDEISGFQDPVSPVKKRSTRSERSLANRHVGELLLLDSDADTSDATAKRSTNSASKRSKTSSNPLERVSKHRKISGPPERRSGRAQRTQNYVDTELETDDPVTDSDATSLKGKGAAANVKKREKEIFRTDYDTAWEDRHWDVCETCRHIDSRKLVYCQGCAVGIHQECLGSRNVMKHHITKVDVGDYVLQCRHCVGRGGQKGGNRSYITGKVGPLCLPFASITSHYLEIEESTAMGEEERNNRSKDMERVQNERASLREKLYDPALVMFRCNNCLRPAMYEDLSDPENDPQFDPAQCMDCNGHRNMSIHLILGWRDLVDDKLDTMEVRRKELPADYLREYLVKWFDHPYTKVEWVNASWLHGVATAKKKNFDAKDLEAILHETNVIPEDYNKVDIVLDVLFEDDNSFEDMDFEDEEEAVEAIAKVKLVLVKWQQVQYDDISWDEPPKRDTDSDILESRWTAFQAAYRDWVRGFYVMVDKQHATKSIKISDAPFTVLEKKAQPAELVGGELMPYQMEGLNWLYYQYYLRHPAILADEMGLGKTIQIISFLSVLFTDWAIAPFLIVAPNSTISNWKREFQKWAPDMRVAAFYGEKSAKSVIEDYEIIHKDTSGQPLKVHALITSYNTIETDSALLKRYNWACLIVDEGQRLKNDESILFRILSDFKVNHRILLTGTPLQNNTRELFNLLQFLDPKKMNAVELESHFDIEKQESLTELHAMLQPYFLRRTKVQVLKFLPSKNEVIVPVTMSSLQRELYKTILSKNAELMRHVMSRSSAGKAIQNYNNTSLGNVLQQIRKILSHPFIYGPDIEEKVVDEQQSLLNLTNACAKLQLLKVLLPELKARGHRVLIFCQFIMMLDILEDWMNASAIEHCRIDGNTPTPERQESIDRFNRPGSKVTCFLLSTRAGGVGINLATADTVIIYDADFNPHQDLQAVARAHRIGQKNKVVVFTLVTRNTAEEKILQIGRKKMVLDQLIIENMATKEENVPYQEILSFGAAALFDEEAKNELVYDVPTVNNLIDSSYADLEVKVDDSANGDKSKDSFGFAKVWAGKGLADEELGEADAAEREASDDLWAKILAQRAIEAKAEADRKSAEFSKGRRRNVKDYNEGSAGKALEIAALNKNADDVSSIADPNEADNVSEIDDYSETRITDSSSDADTSSGDEDSFVGNGPKKDPYRKILGADGIADLLRRPTDGELHAEGETMQTEYVEIAKSCKICGKIHLGGQCQIRNIPIEICTLCRTAHFSNSRGAGGRQCPVFSNITDMKAILDDLKKSAEAPELVEQAKAYLRGVIGTISRAEREQKARLARDANTSKGEPTQSPANLQDTTTPAKAMRETALMLDQSVGVNPPTSSKVSPW
ncbi:putative Chromatin remodeling complex subunit [Taphrina deformans PYCC 5710]|uniref:Chromatin remodeling complex subunit n=1 Tax=Taphrina deformans (strain PYCC 5710 / ATCC 11124 / CBS 356.35 / IMI 108563 / JCM 9778 / NBRC 8474) TaxID=1097556 RepID=R4XFJ6_TAPDE|nr:putative Chromatin remodeling complex subunit [Taphrina deformans PYCC 5710]|eukprot:CCG83252.1 putative Chromatin remodeling complex subunit [Taphrina deformans PYCC 5710]